ncbi:ABC transporter permease [Clostridium magnum]|uniref:Inner membrane ABC transporter permease protein YdcV n=1 Tax=Clostridium magnum DSM 2767 TaxID=1121326 RepID=A0A162QYA4_9CLOT|nr:ABC transporter permease [Clostridium magnum]KZL89144.1 inner membrane ABC transporter permease protein YdcV [Clostridium magnum DSM 2767]SHI03878.1 putative spermidine/putrescine transport system permease protein [Clostridium magnum DSM 2767]
MKRKNGFLTLITTLVYIFLLAPLVIISVTAFGTNEYLKFPPDGFSLRWVENIFKVEMFMKTFKISMEVAVIGTFLALLIGIPAAYVLSRYNFKGKGVLQNLFLSPVIVPGIVLGFSLLEFLIVVNKLPLYPSLLLGHTVTILPYIIRVVSSSLESFDYSIEEAAISLGASRLRTFFIVVMPNVTSGIIAAFILAFINSFNNVPISVFLTGPGISTLPIQMMSYVEYYFDPTVAALSVILMVMTAVLMFVVEKTLGLSFFAK